MRKGVDGLLPVRFAPEPGELFSSWLVRLAMAHVTKLHSFSKFLFPSSQIWNRDIDKSADSAHIAAVSEQTGLPFSQIFASTLRSYEGILYESHNSYGNSAWIMPVGVHRLTRKDYGLQMCPHCLSEDKEAFYRHRWRLSWATVCTKHRTRLLDKCPGCRSPVLFHRGDMGWRNQNVALSMVRCSVCDLPWDSKKILGSIKEADEDAVTFQRKLEDALADGWCEVGNFGMVHSINFFNGLKHLLRVLSVSRRSEAFRESAGRRYDLVLGEIEFSGKSVRSFDYLPHKSRYRTMRLAVRLLTDWPRRFVEIAENAKTFSSAFLPYNDILPFWYGQPIREFLTRSTHPVSESEILSALSFLEKRKTFIMPSDLESLLKRNFFEYTSDRFVVSVYERMRKFNDRMEKGRRRSVEKNAAEISRRREDGCSKTAAKHLARAYRHAHSKPDKLFKKNQKMFDSLISRYKRRERQKMVRRMEIVENAVTVGAEFGVSPGIVTKWCRRYREGGINNLNDLSRKPRTFSHKIVFENQEKWILLLHAEGLTLSEMRDELKNRYGFEITQGGLYRAMNRLKLYLPCSKRNRFIKTNRRKFYAKRQKALEQI